MAWFTQGSRCARQWAWAVGLVVAAGCSRPVEVTFSPGKEVGELDKKFQPQLAGELQRLFGTPSAPQFALGPQGGDLGKQPLLARLTAAHLHQGQAIYLRQCAACHGVGGDGDGEAAKHLDPRPRDYRRGIFKFTSTSYGAKPRRDDLLLTVFRGAKGTSMPAFRFLPKEDREAVVDYVLWLALRGETEYRVAVEAKSDLDPEDPAAKIEHDAVLSAANTVASNWIEAETKVVLPKTPRPAYSPESVATGRQLFKQEACSRCHGDNGGGGLIVEVVDGKSVPQPDSWGFPAKAADLRAGMLHGGHRPLDVYRRIYAGINGTKMPSFDHKFEQQPEMVWHLTHFILSIRETGQFDAAPAPLATTGASP